MDKREKTNTWTKLSFLGKNRPKLQKLDFKSVFIDGKKYTDLKNLEFRRNSLIFRWFPAFGW